jgi:hypothetical protein
MREEKITTVALIIMTIFLIGTIFYFSYLLMQNPSGQSNSSAVAPKKTKAQVVNSEKFVALNQTNNFSPTAQLSPTLTPLTTAETSLSETPTPLNTEEPTPTEIILAKTISPTGSSTNSAYFSPTLSPTKVERLPTTGYLNYNLIIFGSAIFLIFYSFIF